MALRPGQNANPATWAQGPTGSAAGSQPQPTTGGSQLAYKTYQKNGRVYHQYPGGRTVALPPTDRTQGQHGGGGGGATNRGGGPPLGGSGSAASDELRSLFGLAGPTDPRQLAQQAQNEVDLQLRPELDAIGRAREQSKSDYDYLSRVASQYSQQAAAETPNSAGMSDQGKALFGQMQGIAGLRGQENVRDLMDQESAKLTDLAAQEKSVNDKRGGMLMDTFDKLRQQTFTNYATAAGLSGQDIQSLRQYRLGQAGLTNDQNNASAQAQAKNAEVNQYGYTNQQWQGMTPSGRRSVIKASKSWGQTPPDLGKINSYGVSDRDWRAMSTAERQRVITEFKSGGKGGKDSHGLTPYQQDQESKYNGKVWSLIDAGANAFPGLRRTKVDRNKDGNTDGPEDSYISPDEALGLLGKRVSGLDGGLATISMYVARARQGDAKAKMQAIRALKNRGIPIPKELSTAASLSSAERAPGGT
jgi:hypothetical protein